MNEQFSLHLDLPDCNVFGSACTDNSSFRCSPSAYLMQISWIFVCRASFRQVTASIDALQLLLLHAYYFCASTCQRTIFHVRSTKLSSDARLSLPERRYKDLPLRRQRGIQLLNGTKKKSVTEEGLGPFDPRFRKPMLYPTELLSLIWGERS